MAKKSRRVVRGEPGYTATTPTGDPISASGDRTRRPRSRRTHQPSFYERYRNLIIGGVAILGLFIVGFLFLQGANSKAYVCDSLLTPGPVESLTPQPSVLAPATPAATESPAATGSPSATGSPEASPAASLAASPAASPAASLAETAAPSESPAASPQESGSPAPSVTPQAAPTPRLGFTTEILGRSHVPFGSTITYGFCPPSSGNHYNNPPQAPLPPRVYPPNEEKTPGTWVHNLEHGYVVLLYRCPSGQLGVGDCPTQAEMDLMTQWFDQAPAPPSGVCPKKVLVARFDSMDTQFALVAWGRVLLIDEFDLDQALTFAQQWMEHDAVPEPNAC